MTRHFCDSTRIRNEHQRCFNKPAQGKRGTSAALGVELKKNKALKGRHTLSRPFRALSMIGGFTQGVALGRPVAGPLALDAAAVTIVRPVRL